MKKTLIIPAVIGLLAVPSFALAHNGADNSTTARVGARDNTTLDVHHDDKVAIPATPAVPATPGHDNDADGDNAATPAVPASPASVDNDSDDVAGQVETENETNTTVPDDSGHHAMMSASTEHGHDSVSIGAKIDN